MQLRCLLQLRWSREWGSANGEVESACQLAAGVKAHPSKQVDKHE